MRLALNVVIQNYGDFVNVLYLQLDISLKGLKKTTKNLNHDDRPYSRNMTPAQKGSAALNPIRFPSVSLLRSQTRGTKQNTFIYFIIATFDGKRQKSGGQP